MEYVAFLFLGLGVLLVLAGVLLQASDRRAGTRPLMEDYALRSTRPEGHANPLAAPVTNTAPTTATSAPVISPSSALGSAIPGPFQFVQQATATPTQVQTTSVSPVAVSVGQANPRLFEKFAYLYLDSSSRNVYDGAGSVTAFDLSEVQGIRRFGRGLFSYDGFSFYFDHASGQERFPLTNLRTIGFYPNCVALTFRTSQPVALLFMEETETIRRVLETFRAEAAGNVAG